MDEASDRAAKAARYSRSQFRARQHAEAHAEIADEKPLRIIDHPLVPRNPGELIDTQDALSEFISHLRDSKLFAYDSEFIGELTYHPQLCLIQASTKSRVGLIDPIADIDLRPFWELIADASIEKIVHAGEQDLEPVNRLIGQRAANVFDTQIAAGFAGLAYPVGLSKLVHELLGVKLGKGLTFSHWDQRPLTAMQLRYAADDVRYLLAVHQELSRRINLLDHMDWVRDECDTLCEPDRLQFDPEADFLRIRGAGALSPAGLAILRELMIWRNAAAQRHDVPPRAFLKDEVLMDLARSPVKTPDKFARVKGLPRPVEDAHGAEIIEVTMRGAATPAEDRPVMKSHEPTPSERFGSESLYAAIAAMAVGQSIDPALLASRQDSADLFYAIQNKTDLSDSKLLNGWRAAACGEQLIRMIGGDGKFTLCWRDGRLSIDCE